jgi:hypothetical protein
MKNKQTPLQRINRIMKFYYSRGQNRENVNEVYRNIIKQKLEGSN